MYIYVYILYVTSLLPAINYFNDINKVKAECMLSVCCSKACQQLVKHVSSLKAECMLSVCGTQRPHPSV